MNATQTKAVVTAMHCYDVSRMDIMGTNREKDIARARQMLCYLLRKKCFLYYAHIGRMLGLHHSTVMFHFRKIDTAIDPEIIAERDKAELFFKQIKLAQYDKNIPF